MEAILYSTGCPKCTILKRKLDEKGIRYTENNDVDEMVAMGLTQAPALEIDGEVLDFSSAVEWLRNR